MKLVLPQFAPLYFFIIFLFIWLSFISKVCVLWWSCKRSYNF
uniref:ATP synthase subunit 8 n=1 Tax=Ruditapes philippinarum TaxID=129788 RepID=A0A8A5N0W0_RUDPH|nr:ATP synthase subunit 8 [Ruditapes philippinarum]